MTFDLGVIYLNSGVRPGGEIMRAAETKYLYGLKIHYIAHTIVVYIAHPLLRFTSCMLRMLNYNISATECKLKMLAIFFCIIPIVLYS